MWTIRRATARDLDAVDALERAAFQPYRQASRASLRRSLQSPMQSVWLAVQHGRGRKGEGGLDPGGLLVLWHFPHRVRVYDVAVHPRWQGQGIGRLLMAHAEDLARKAGARWVSLEADPKEPHLVAWYEGQGYRRVERLPGYYRNGNAAVRLVKGLG